MEKDYYSKDFDPNSLTKQKLKSILSAEDVELPGTDQKKNFYVDLFLHHVRGKLKSDVVPSSKGIIHVSKTGTPIRGHEDSPWSSPSTVKSPRRRSISNVRTPTSKIVSDTGKKTIKSPSPRGKRSPSKSPRRSRKRTETPSRSPGRSSSRSYRGDQVPTATTKRSPRTRQLSKSDSKEEKTVPTREELPSTDSALDKIEKLRSRHFILTDDPNEPIKIAQSPPTIAARQGLEHLDAISTTRFAISPIKGKPASKPSPARPILKVPYFRPKRKMFNKLTLQLLLIFLIGLSVSMWIYRSMKRPFCDFGVSERRKSCFFCIFRLYYLLN
jgi:hypothetical protein